MKYYSTNLDADMVSFREALLQGQAPDRGLYLPTHIPMLSKQEMEGFSTLSYPEIALRVMWPYLEGEIPYETLQALTLDAYDFPVPLEKVTDISFVMRLDQGPTASFKDFAARMMGRLMQYYLEKQDRNLLILTATSGDTGSAIAHAFLGLDRIKVVVLFPRDEVTLRQRKQMTTLGRNIEVIAMDGKFDDCQALVKQAFSDPDLAALQLSSANSINIGRLVPQSVYYFYAWSRLAEKNQQIVFSVPSGNFGDMMGGVMAMKMGLPVKKFIIAVNENDEFPHFLATGMYQKIEPSRNCISSAMNVGHPSNLARLTAFYKGVMDEKGGILQGADMEAMREEIWSVSVSDALTRTTMTQAWKEHGLLLEPHGAVGWAGLQAWLKQEGDKLDDTPCVSLETAHPAKFPEEILRLLGIDPELPPSLQGLEGKEEAYLSMAASYAPFKKHLIGKYA